MQQIEAWWSSKHIQFMICEFQLEHFPQQKKHHYVRRINTHKEMANFN